MPPFDKATVEVAQHAAELAKAGKLIAEPCAYRPCSAKHRLNIMVQAVKPTNGMAYLLAKTQQAVGLNLPSLGRHGDLLVVACQFVQQILTGGAKLQNRGGQRRALGQLACRLPHAVL